MLHYSRHFDLYYNPRRVKKKEPESGRGSGAVFVQVFKVHLSVFDLIMQRTRKLNSGKWDPSLGQWVEVT